MPSRLTPRRRRAVEPMRAWVVPAGARGREPLAPMPSHESPLAITHACVGGGRTRPRGSTAGARNAGRGYERPLRLGCVVHRKWHSSQFPCSDEWKRGFLRFLTLCVWFPSVLSGYWPPPPLVAFARESGGSRRVGGGKYSTGIKRRGHLLSQVSLSYK
ncbi:hypothetical protein SEVIR_9G279201v4 [Setaria viridis]